MKQDTATLDHRAEPPDQSLRREAPSRSVVYALLVCGILSSIFYVAADVISASMWDGYRFVDRAVSEMLAVHSPVRGFIVWPMSAYNLLVVAFGVGVWFAARGKRSLRITSVMLVVYGVISWLGLFAFPLRPDSPTAPGEAMPLSGVLHSAATFVLVLLMFLFIGFGAAGLGRRFRIFSIATIALVLGGGVVAGTYIDRLAAGLVTPWFGVIERTNIYASLLWVAVFAIALIRRLASEPLGNVAQPSVAPKNVAVFVGSAHRGGNTAKAAHTFLEHLESLGGVNGELVFLGDYDLKVCRGCRACFDRGEEYCPLRDDRDELFAKLDAADAVVFATPNYLFGPSALLKVFMDRLSFMAHRPRYHGKVFTPIVVQGIYGGGKIAKYLEFAGASIGFTTVRGSVIRTLQPMTDDALRAMDKKLAQQARRFHDQLERPATPVPSLFGVMMFRMSRTAVRMGVPEGRPDYDYYRDRDWFASDYYYPTHLGPAKKAAGAFFDWLFAVLPMFKVADDTSPMDNALT